MRGKVSARLAVDFSPSGGRQGGGSARRRPCGRCPGGPGGPGGPVERRSNEIALGRRLRSRHRRAFQRLLNEAALSGRCTGPPGQPGRPGQGLRKRFGAASACGRCPGGPGRPGGPVERQSNEIALGRRLRSRDLRAFQRLLNEAALSGRCTGPPGQPGRPGQRLGRRLRSR